MEEKISKVNIEEIMEQIRKDIEQKGYKDDILDFDDMIVSTGNLEDNEYFSTDLLDKDIEYVNQHWNIPIYNSLNSDKAISFIKKVIRKSIQFFVVPIAENQNEFNASIVRCLNMIKQFINKQGDIENRLDELDFRFNKDVKKQLMLMKSSYAQIVRENDNMGKLLFQMQEKQTEDEEIIKRLELKLEIVSLKCQKNELLQSEDNK